MKEWRPPRSWGATALALGVLLTLGGALALASLLGADLLRPPGAFVFSPLVVLVTLGAVLLLAGSILLALNLQRRLTLRFTISRDAVVATWRGGECVIPLQALAAGSGEDPSLPEVRLGHGSRDNTIVFQTRAARYVLAVADAESFTREVAARMALGAVRSPAEGLSFRHATLRSFAVDRLVRWSLGLALLINVLLWLVVAWRYAALPPTIVARFDPLGGPAGTRPRSYLLLLLAASLAGGLLNAVLAAALHRRSLAASQLLVLLALLLQLLMSVAVALILAASA